MSKTNSALSQKRLKDLLHYDEDTGIFTWRVNRGWHSKAGSIAGANSAGYIIIGIDQVRYKAHRLAWLYVYGEFPSDQIDHININKSDNRISNLRIASNWLNSNNYIRHPKSGNPAGTEKHGKLWRAHIQVLGRRVCIGKYYTAEEAHKAYLKAKQKLHHFFYPPNSLAICAHVNPPSSVLEINSFGLVSDVCP